MPASVGAQRPSPRPLVRASVAASNALPATLSVGLPVGAADERVVEPHRGDGCDDVDDVAAVLEVLRDFVELCDVLGSEELGDGVALVHRHERDHRLAAEELLVGDAVLVDLVGLVEVAVLTGRELEVGDPIAEDHGDHPADSDHPDPVLAEVQTEPTPELVHVYPPFPR